MYLSESDQIIYMANVIFLANADGVISPKKLAALDDIRQAISAKKSSYDVATKRALSGNYKPTKVEGFSAQVSNLADMLYVSIVDGELSEPEKIVIRELSAATPLTEEQSLLLTREAINRVKNNEFAFACPSCKAAVDGEAKYCPKCGAPLGGAVTSPNLEFQIPAIGYAIEFCESTSAAFPAALKLAQTAPSFASCLSVCPESF